MIHFDFFKQTKQNLTSYDFSSWWQCNRCGCWWWRCATTIGCIVRDQTTGTTRCDRTGTRQSTVEHGLIDDLLLRVPVRQRRCGAVLLEAAEREREIDVAAGQLELDRAQLLHAVLKRETVVGEIDLIGTADDRRIGALREIGVVVRFVDAELKREVRNLKVVDDELHAQMHERRRRAIDDKVVVRQRADRKRLVQHDLVERRVRQEAETRLAGERLIARRRRRRAPTHLHFRRRLNDVALARRRCAAVLNLCLRLPIATVELGNNVANTHRRVLCRRLTRTPYVFFVQQ